MRIRETITTLALTLALTAGSIAHAATEMLDAATIRQNLGLLAYSPNEQLKTLKVAILDNGFEGFAPARKQLPASAELINPTNIPAGPTNHGLGMAQILWSLTGKSADGPKFYLINSNGFSNFKAAVQYVIDQKIDVVLYSQVWPFGGNFDGTGFINAQVTRAIQNGVIWINAAGNNGGMVYNGYVNTHRYNDGDTLSFNPDGYSRDHLRFENPVDENELTVTLSWTDFQDTETYNTSKDLNLYIYDENDKLVGSSELIQKGQAPAPGDNKVSSHAREQVVLRNLDRGNYRIKIKVGGGTFEDNVRFRVLIKAEKGATFTDRTSGEEIMPPADNPYAITIGENVEFSAVGPTTDGRVKPDMLINDASVSFTNGAQFRGSSTAAAFFAASVVAMKSYEPRITASSLLAYLNRIKSGSGFNDLQETDPSRSPTTIRALIPQGGKLMIHKGNGHSVILSPDDPFMLPGPRAAGVRRYSEDDILVYRLDSKRWYVVPASRRDSIVAPGIEFRQGTSGSNTWKTPSPYELDGLTYN